MDLFDIAVARKLAGGGGGVSVLAVDWDYSTMALNKTWGEINEAFPMAYILMSVSGTTMKMSISSIVVDAGGTYYIFAKSPEGDATFTTDNENGYPVISQ